MPQSTKCKPSVPKNREFFTISKLSKGERKRINYQLKNNKDVGSSIKSSVKKLMKCSDYNLSCRPIKISPITSQKTNSTIQHHASLAALYKINLSTVQKHYSILTNIPQVPINKISIEKETSSTKSISNFRLSPVFGSKRKSVSKIKNYIKPGNSDLKNLVIQNYSKYLKTLNVKIEEENFTNKSLVQKLDKSINQKLHISLSTTLQSKHVKNCELIDNESKVITCAKSVKSIANSTIKKSKTITKNNFFKVKNKVIEDSQKYHEKNKSLWTKEFCDDDFVTNEKQFIETFQKTNNKKRSKNKTDIVLNKDPDIKVKQHNTEKENETNKLKNKIENNNNNKQVKILDSSSNSDLSTKSTIDSLSVNCQIFNEPNIKKNYSSNLIEYSIVKSYRPIPFGSCPFVEEQSITIQHNIDNYNINTLQNHKKCDKLTVGLLKDADKIKEEFDNSNDSFISLDSPIDLKLKFPVKKKQMSNLSCNSVINKDDKCKVNPKVKSNIMLPNNIITSSGLKYSGHAKFQSKLKSSPFLNSKELENLCSKPKQTSTDIIQETINNIDNDASLLHELEINDIKKCIANSPKTISMKRNNLNVEFSQTKLDLNGGLKEYQQKNNTIDCNNVEESFDSLCQVVSKLSKNENITLYKSTNDDTIMESEKIIIRLSKDNHKNSDFEIPVILENNTNETYSSTGNTKKSPITFQRSSELNLNLKSSSTPKPANIISPPTVFSRLQSQHSSNMVDSLKPEITRVTDLKVNRSISPVKPLSTNEKNPKLNESKTLLIKETSQLNPLLIDSVTQNSENNNCSKIRIVDPRLRKRKIEDQTAMEITRDVQDQKNEKNFSPTFSIHEDSSPFTTKKKRLSVFQRLGMKAKPSSTLDENVDGMSTELLNILKNDEEKEQKNNMDHESDDDWLSLHPYESFSSDEEANNSPPHRKFTSERPRANEESERIRNQPISIKDRLNWNAPRKNRKQFQSKTITLINKNNKEIKKHQTTEESQPSKQQISDNQHFMGMLPNASITTTPNFSEYSNNDIVFNDKFYKMNTAQMLQDVNNFKIQELEKNVYSAFSDENMERTCKFDYMSMLDGSNKFIKSSMNELKYFFKSYCFQKLRNGNCVMQDKCHYSHKIGILRNQIKKNSFRHLLIILDIAINNSFEFFVTQIWSSILPILQNNAFNVYKKLYQVNMRSESFIHNLLEYCLQSKLHSVESFVKKISTVVEQGDRETVRVICAVVKDKLADGFCWEAIKDLCQRAVPPNDIIELILVQCLNRKKKEAHIIEVYDMVKNKLKPLERNQISQTILKPFLTLAQNKQANLEKQTSNTMPLADIPNNTNNLPGHIQRRSQSIDSVLSMEKEKSSPPVFQTLSMTTIPTGQKNKKKLTSSETSILSPQQPNNSPIEVRITTPNKGESTNFSDYVVKEIDYNEPKSSYRDNFWKLYLTVHNVKEGLNHNDYEYVWKVMDEFSKENVQDELLRRAYYHILCKSVKSCEQRVSQVIKQAVRTRWSTSRKSIDILFDVGVYALIDLANSELWVMALQLLSSVKILEPDKLNTTFVLISAEIYLANNDPLEALYLLQRTCLLKSDHNNWLTNDITEEHKNHRNKLLVILLQALSYTNPDKAVYLFQTLLTDQYVLHYPIDLACFLDKLMLILLLKNENDLVADLCRIVMDNDLTFQKSVYQELLSQMLPVDETLTNQILDYAIHLGYYTDVKIRNGFTTLIIDMNYSEEELYLILKRLINKLILSVGPVIERLKPHKLKVILIFEDIPTDKRLYINETAVMIKKRYKGIRNLVSTILLTRFTPGIKLARKKTDKFCQIVSRTLVDYLKYWN